MGSFIETDMGPKTKIICLCAVFGRFYSTFFYKVDGQYIVSKYSEDPKFVKIRLKADPLLLKKGTKSRANQLRIFV